MRLMVVRHGATLHNLDGRFTGQVDAPLSPLGERQAEALADRLARMRFDVIISSDLVRARATAEAIARRHDQPVMIEAALREISMGDWEGRAVSEIKRDQPELLARIESDPTGHTSAPGGETWTQFSARTHDALARWRAEYPGGRVLWVAHGGTVSVLLLNALGLSYERRQQFKRGNASLFELDYRSRGVFIMRVNDTSHLDHLDAEQEGERFQAL